MKNLNSQIILNALKENILIGEQNIHEDMERRNSGSTEIDLKNHLNTMKLIRKAKTLSALLIVMDSEFSMGIEEVFESYV